MTALRNGQCTQDPRLDRIRQVDLRSLDYPVSDLLEADMYRAPRSYTWGMADEVLDQGPDGSCVGHGFAHEMAARPGVVTGVDHEFAVEVYHGAQRRDPWPGGSYEQADPFYEGTSVLAGAQEVKARGWIREYRWALSLHDLITTLGYHGPVVAGLDWTEGMFEPDDDGFIRPTGDVAGGHCIVFSAIKVVLNRAAPNPMQAVDPVRSYGTILNSWGREWGSNGRARLALVDLAVLWGNGEFCVPVGRRAGSV